MRIRTALVLAAGGLAHDAPERHFTGDELLSFSNEFRRHIRTLIPAVIARAERLPERHPDRVSAMMCVGQARVRLQLEPGDTDAVRGSVAVRLAGTARSLGRHHERLVTR
ncbi:DUF6415 family natural product biosynthesis protein [Streptomyces sp. NPDC051014]|uniref:DUF6415 family natural product biosynthesis protein n=1 Tax=Streptomyces sp. NPDC051014 TaxID=3155751 RepID=UPI0033FFF32D